MRKVPTQVGATTGNNGRTEGMPEVQEPVLEHAASETQNAQVTSETLSQNSDVVNLVTSVTEIRIMDWQYVVRLEVDGTVAILSKKPIQRLRLGSLSVLPISELDFRVVPAQSSANFKASGG